MQKYAAIYDANEQGTKYNRFAHLISPANSHAHVFTEMPTVALPTLVRPYEVGSRSSLVL